MEHDKTYMWLTIITFIGFTTGVIFGFMHMNSYKDQAQVQVSQNPFK